MEERVDVDLLDKGGWDGLDEFRDGLAELGDLCGVGADDLDLDVAGGLDDGGTRKVDLGGGAARDLGADVEPSEDVLGVADGSWVS